MINFLKKIFSNKTRNNEEQETLQTKQSGKLIENDIDTNKIINDFDARKKRQFKIIKEKFGFDPSDNDVLWGLFQELYSENYLKNHKVLLNVEYQRGLLLQKEKKYKDAIAQYSSGLFYLLNAYPYTLSPEHFKSDIEGKEIYKGQFKFFNKLIKCMNAGNMDKKAFILSASHSIGTISLNGNISSNTFISELTNHLRYDFFNINLAKDIEISKIDIYRISFFASKARDLIKYLTKEKRVPELKEVLHFLYLLGCFDKYLFGSYKVGYAYTLAEYKQKNFLPSEYRYKGKKITYQTTKDDYEKMTNEYKKVFNTSKVFDFCKIEHKPFLNDKDYKLMDKYLL